MSDGFFHLGDGISVGKGLDALSNSQQLRNQLIALFGGTSNIPSSVMRAQRGKPTNDFDAPAQQRGYDNTSSLKKRDLNDALKKAFSASGKGCSFGALSSFPQNICRSMVLLYSEPGQTVFDPFAGHNSRMHACVTAGRNYIGCDLSTEFMIFNKKLAKKLRQDYPETSIQLYHTDSRKVPAPDECGDFTITSPPYWDIEYYGDEAEQLGKSSSYDKFLQSLGQVMKENYRCLKPGSYAVWFINDFRRKGKMHFYHMDVKDLGEQAGFVAHDILITDFGPGIRDCFLNQIVETRILPKRHEYGMVFRKPL